MTNWHNMDLSLGLSDNGTQVLYHHSTSHKAFYYPKG